MSLMLLFHTLVLLVFLVAVFVFSLLSFLAYSTVRCDRLSLKGIFGLRYHSRSVRVAVERLWVTFNRPRSASPAYIVLHISGLLIESVYVKGPTEPEAASTGDPKTLPAWLHALAKYVTIRIDNIRTSTARGTDMLLDKLSVHCEHNSDIIIETGRLQWADIYSHQRLSIRLVWRKKTLHVIAFQCRAVQLDLTRLRDKLQSSPSVSTSTSTMSAWSNTPLERLCSIKLVFQDIALIDHERGQWHSGRAVLCVLPIPPYAFITPSACEIEFSMERVRALRPDHPPWLSLTGVRVRLELSMWQPQPENAVAHRVSAKIMLDEPHWVMEQKQQPSQEYTAPTDTFWPLNYNGIPLPWNSLPKVDVVIMMRSLNVQRLHTSSQATDTLHANQLSIRLSNDMRVQRDIPDRQPIPIAQRRWSSMFYTRRKRKQYLQRKQQSQRKETHPSHVEENSYATCHMEMDSCSLLTGKLLVATLSKASLTMCSQLYTHLQADRRLTLRIWQPTLDQGPSVDIQWHIEKIDVELDAATQWFTRQRDREMPSTTRSTTAPLGEDSLVSLWLKNATIRGAFDLANMAYRDVDRANIDVVHPGFLNNAPKQDMQLRLTVTTRGLRHVNGRLNVAAGRLYRITSDSSLHDILSVDGLQAIGNDISCSQVRLLYSLANHYVCLICARRLFSVLEPAVSQGSSNRDALRIRIDTLMLHAQLHGETRLSFIVQNGMYGQRQVRAADVTIFDDARPGDHLVDIDALSVSQDEDTVHVAASKIQLHVPYNYILANVIDSAIVLSKAIMALHSEHTPRMSLNGPNKRNEPVVLPFTLTVDCDLFTLDFGDDPFEAKLRRIFCIGMEQQAVRMAHEEVFQAKAEQVLTNSQEKSTGDQRRNPDPSKGLPSRQSSFFSDILNLLTSRYINKAGEDELSSSKQFNSSATGGPKSAAGAESSSSTGPKNNETLVENARIQLLQHHEKIWISQIKQAQQVEGSATTPLAQLTMQRLRLEFIQPIDLLVHARDFIHRVGHGVPRTFDCSVVLPFHLAMRVRETFIQVRNYPIPFLYVPYCPNQDTASWTLQGDYVIVDELGEASIARTRIAVPVLPDYTLQVVRTASPVKFYSDVTYRIETSGLSTICWSNSYHPAIQDMLRVLDTLTAPLVDPSPRLGFWDKIRLLFHMRVQIQFCQGDFGWIMKGSRNPYTLTGAGAGLAKIWQGGPSTVWYLGYENEQHEFTQVITQERYAMGVPDFAHCMAYYQSNDQQPVLSFMHYLEKPVVQIVGGVRMGIGWHLERLFSREEPNGTVTRGRLRLFRPHYSIRFRTPMYAKSKDHDSFAGFRSDCIHISTSIVAHESALVSFHLTPGFADHLMAWLDLFGGPLSLNIREGTLYRQMDPRPNKRFTASITDVEFKFLFPGQVRCGYYARDEFTAHENEDDPTTAVVGLHIVCEDFKMDMHQRRSWQTISTDLLGDKIVSSYPICEAEFSVDNMTVDAVRAAVVERNSHNRKQDLDADFIELGSPQSPPAHVEHLRLASTPCFYYFKQGKRTGVRHAMHECIFAGTPLDTREIQGTILQHHANEAQRQMLGKMEQERVLQEQLEQLPDSHSSLALRLQSAIVRLKRRIDYLEDRYDHLDDLVHQLSLCQIGTDPRLTAQEDEKFEQRCVIHNPRISWNNSVRNIIYQLIDVRSHRRVLEFDLSARAIRLIDTLLDQFGSYVPTPPLRYPTENDDDDVTTPQDVQTLIDQLLHDKGNGHLFVVPNETEEEKEAATRRTAAENALPSNYKLAHNHAIDLLNPQISFQSDRCPDAIVLLSSSRMRLNGRSILDIDTADMDPVKRRFVVDIHKAQIYVSPLTPAAPLPWIPLELLVDDEDAEGRLAVGSFRRVCQRPITGTIRYDRYNRLRWQPRLVLQQEEEECDTVTVQFPQLSISATPSQYHAFHCVVSDLLMYQETAEKERLDRLHELILAMETNNNTSLQAIRTQVLELQHAVRTCTRGYDKRALLDQLYLTMRTVQILPTYQQQQHHILHQNKKRHEDTIQLSMLFFFEQLMWEMCDNSGQPFCEWILQDTHVAIKRHERSSTFALEVGRVHGNDTTGPVLAPYHAGPRRQHDRIKMVRVFLASLAPVGGIPIVQHLEINLHPLRLQLTYDFGKALAAYIFQSPSAPPTATAPTSRISTATFDNDLWSSDEDSIKKRKRLRKRRPSPATQSLIAHSIQERRGSHPPAIMTAEEVMIMKRRASSNRTFLYIKIPGAKHCLSYRGPKRRNIEDLSDFVFRQPDLEYRNRTWS
ncbi:golgi-body localization protein domain-domain-containing protein [Syncephalastrum racemosum]|uniref:Golgi-body localization protein domain-domain-containing protein n=1 Tax=Syncephalastrum racemosum TaxID=13706 RepID=A0A1X2H1G3_SYNRA|nr:golgi-body localization protein domain-domain-containing protein [Syncephalastrum racemosum]